MVTMQSSGSGQTVLPQGGGHNSDDLVGDGDDCDCLAGGDVRKVGRVARIHCPLLETLEIEFADLRPNGFGLQRHQYHEIVGLAKLSGSVYE